MNFNTPMDTSTIVCYYLNIVNMASKDKSWKFWNQICWIICVYQTIICKNHVTNRILKTAKTSKERFLIFPGYFSVYFQEVFKTQREHHKVNIFSYLHVTQNAF